jgi:hypothetical protein
MYGPHHDIIKIDASYFKRIIEMNQSTIKRILTL